MRRMLLAVIVVGTICRSAFAQQAVTPNAVTPNAAGTNGAASSTTAATETAQSDGTPAQASWITHRRAGQLQWLDPANWEIRGCSTFTAVAIRSALAVDIDVTLATHPSAPADNLDTLPALLRDKIVAGYQSLGFYRPQVNVQHARDDKKILIDIVEGQRYACGAIGITGMKTLSPAQIATELTRVRSGAVSTPIWQQGQPAGFSAVDLAKMRKSVQQAFADLGRPSAKLDLKVEPNGATARLSLQITDEGAATTVDQVVVSGCVKNSEQQVLDYLAVKPGTVWTRDERSRVEKLLLQSARFREFKVDYTAATNGAAGTLAVNVVECKSGPALSEAFSPEEEALLKFGEWLATFNQSTDDLVCTVVEGKTSVETVFSPQQGCVITIRQQTDEKQATAPPARSVVLAIDTLGLYSEVNGRQWVARPLPSYIGSTYEFHIAAVGDEGRTNLMWGMGLRSTVQTSDKRPAMQVTVKAAPSALVGLAHQADTHCSLANDVLTVELAKTADRQAATIRIDARTGRLLDGVATDEKGGQGRLSLAAGAYTQRVKNLEGAWSQKANDFKLKQPLTSVLDFLLDEARTADFASLELVPPMAVNAVHKAVGQGLFEPFDQYLLQSAAKFTPPLFSIPYDYDSRPQFVSMVGKFAFVSWMLGNDVAARDTWPWVLTREATAWFTGLDEYQQLELAEQLELPGNGPLCCLTTAGLLALAGQNEQARQFATLGLEQLSPESFHSDVADLLDERGLVGRCLLKIADVLRETDTLTVAVIGFVLPEEEQQLLTNVYIDLTKDKSRPIAQVLPEVLDRQWATSIKPCLETALKAVKERAANAPSQLAKPGDDSKPPATARDVRRDEGAGSKK